MIGNLKVGSGGVFVATASTVFTLMIGSSAYRVGADDSVVACDRKNHYSRSTAGRDGSGKVHLGREIADIGRGGYFALPLARRAHDGCVYAVGVQPEMLSIVRERMESAGIRAI